MEWYPWLNTYFKELIVSYLAGKAHHALLIHTIPGIGDEVLVYAISRLLMCQNPEKYKSCRKCHSCQLMSAKTHPDYYVIEPKEDKITFGVDIVREISEKIYERAYLGGSKIVWFRDVSQLTEAASNALLKVLEEPPERTWFFFSYFENGILQATLRSRCRFYWLKIPDESLAIRWLLHKMTTTKLSLKELFSALRICGGAPVAALIYLQPEIWSQREKLCNYLENVSHDGNWFSLLKILNCEEVVRQLYWLASILLDAIKLQHGSTLINNVDIWLLINTLASNLRSNFIKDIYNDVCTVRKQLMTILGVNRELLLANMLLSIEYYLQSESKKSFFSL